MKESFKTPTAVTTSIGELPSSEMELVESSSSMVRTSYRELEDFPIVEQNQLEEFRQNLNLLMDLQNRFSFMMSEIKYLLRIEN